MAMMLTMLQVPPNVVALRLISRPGLSVLNYLIQACSCLLPSCTVFVGPNVSVASSSGRPSTGGEQPVVRPPAPGDDTV